MTSLASGQRRCFKLGYYALQETSSLRVRPSTTSRGDRLNRSREQFRSASIFSQAQPSMTPQSPSPNKANVTVTIVGSGRIGSALVDMSPYPTKLVKRGERVNGDDEGPIIVCTRNDAMDAVLEATPNHRKNDLVFLQNGMLLPWLEERGLAENTQALIYFGVAKLGDPPMDGVTDLDPDGLTTVWGEHAETVKDVINAGNLACKAVDKKAFLRAMLEKLIWICAIMLIGTKHGVKVGEVVQDHTAEVTSLMNELAKEGENQLGVTVSENMVERLIAYSLAVASYPCAIKEFEWRNGWFHQLSQDHLAKGEEDPCPLHSALLKEVGAV